MGGAGQGLGGSCVCPNCGYSTSHLRMDPCMHQGCPKCGTKLVRKS